MHGVSHVYSLFEWLLNALGTVLVAGGDAHCQCHSLGVAQSALWAGLGAVPPEKQADFIEFIISILTCKSITGQDWIPAHRASVQILTAPLVGMKSCKIELTQLWCFKVQKSQNPI